MKKCVQMFRQIFTELLVVERDGEFLLSYWGGKGWWWKTKMHRSLSIALKEFAVLKQAISMHTWFMIQG